MWPLSELTSCASEIQLRCQFVNLICLSLLVDFSTRSLALSLSLSLKALIVKFSDIDEWQRPCENK